MSSCGYSKTERSAFETQIKAYNKKYNLGLKPTGSGLYLKIDSLGAGRNIQIQDSVWVSYSLKLLSGKIIEVQDVSPSTSYLTISNFKNISINFFF